MTTLGSSRYATLAYHGAQVQPLSPVEIMFQLYDFAIAGCVAGDRERRVPRSWS